METWKVFVSGKPVLRQEKVVLEQWIFRSQFWKHSKYSSWSRQHFRRPDRIVLEMEYFPFQQLSGEFGTSLTDFLESSESHNSSKQFEATIWSSSIVLWSFNFGLFSYFRLALSHQNWWQKSSLGNGFISRKGALAIFFSPIQLFVASVHSCGGSLWGKLAFRAEIKIRIGEL